MEDVRGRGLAELRGVGVVGGGVGPRAGVVVELAVVVEEVKLPRGNDFEGVEARGRVGGGDPGGELVTDLDLQETR